jgi:DNA-binding NarL/FixJ family response regulator
LSGPREYREGQELLMASRVLVYASQAEEMDAILSALKVVPDAEVVGVVQDKSNITIGVRKFSPDVLLIRTDDQTDSILDITSELRAENAIGGIIVIVGKVLDNSEVIMLLRSGVNAIISDDALPEDFGTAIREASSNRLFLPPRRRDLT